MAAVVLGLVALAARQTSDRRARVVGAFCQEVALIAALYMVWRLARQLPLVQEAGAYDRAMQIWELQRALHLPSELAMENWLIGHEALARLTVLYYSTMHVPSLLLFLLWMWVRHRDQYPRWRNALAITTGFCLVIRFVRVAPPRLMPELGFVDLPAMLGHDIYGPVGTGVSDQFAAMPSIHVAWAAVVGLGIWFVAPRRWAWIGPLHLTLTMWAVMATANHWWLDGLVAIALVVLSLGIDEGCRRLAATRRAARQPSEQSWDEASPPTPELASAP